MIDETEPYRRSEVARLNSEIVSDDPIAERKRLEASWGQVWDTQQLSQDYEVKGFMAPFVVVKRKYDGCLGSLEFQHYPRFYFNFTPDSR